MDASASPNVSNFRHNAVKTKVQCVHGRWVQTATLGLSRGALLQVVFGKLCEVLKFCAGNSTLSQLQACGGHFNSIAFY